MFSLHKINLAKWQGQTISLITTNSLQPLHIKNILKLNLSSMTEHVLFIFLNNYHTDIVSFVYHNTDDYVFF